MPEDSSGGRLAVRERLGRAADRSRQRWRLSRDRWRGLWAAARGADVRSLAVAVLAAVVTALVGAAVGQWIGWRGAGTLPRDDEAAAIARLAFGGEVPAPQRRDDLFGYELVPDRRLVAVVGGHGYGPGHVRFSQFVDTGSAAFRSRARDVRVRLRTAGWRIDRAGSGALLFVADKGRLRVRYTVAEPGRVTLDIVRAQPVWVLPLGAVGGLVGGFCGWIAARWMTRRLPRLPTGPGRRAGRLARVGFVGVLPALVVTGIDQALACTALSRPQIPLWTAGMAFGIRPITLVGLVALGAAVLLAGVARPRRR